MSLQAVAKPQLGEQSLSTHLHLGGAISCAAALTGLQDAFQGGPWPSCAWGGQWGSPQHHCLTHLGVSSTFPSCTSGRGIWGCRGEWGVPDQGTAGQLGTQGWMKANPVPHLSGCSELHCSCAEPQESPKKPQRDTHCPLALAKELELQQPQPCTAQLFTSRGTRPPDSQHKGP